MKGSIKSGVICQDREHFKNPKEGNPWWEFSMSINIGALESWVRSFVARCGIRVASHALPSLVCNILTRNPERETRNILHHRLFIPLRFGINFKSNRFVKRTGGRVLTVYREFDDVDTLFLEVV